MADKAPAPFPDEAKLLGLRYGHLFIDFNEKLAHFERTLETGAAIHSRQK